MESHIVKNRQMDWIVNRLADSILEKLSQNFLQTHNQPLPEGVREELLQRVKQQLSEKTDLSRLIESLKNRAKQNRTSEDGLTKAIRVSRDFYLKSVENLAPALEASIAKTFQKIAESIEKTFFERIVEADRKLKRESQKWREILNELRKVTLFNGIDDFDLIGIAEAVEQRVYQKDTPVFTIGMPGTGFYICSEKIAVHIDDGYHVRLSQAEIFGERTYADEKSRQGNDFLMAHDTTVSPLKDCTLYFIPREKFYIIPKIPGLEQKIFHKILYDARQDRIRAKEQTRQTTEILDNIGRGWLSINDQGEIGAHAAVVCDYLQSSDLKGLSFADKAFAQDKKALRNYYRALHTLFNEDDFDHEIIMSLLPRETVIGKNIFELYYSFVEDEKGRVLSLFIQMKDVTKERDLMERNEQDKRIHQKMNENIGGFLETIQQIQKTNDELENFLTQYLDPEIQPENEYLNNFLRLLHSTKGLVGTFGFETLKGIIHQYETCFIAMKSSGIVKQIDPILDLQVQWSTQSSYAKSFKESLGADIINRFNGINYTQEEQRTLEQAVLKGDFELLKRVILDKTKILASELIRGWEKDILLLAEELGKQVELHQKIDNRLLLPDKMTRELNTVLRHLYRNCVDHGIESAETRLKLGKPAMGIIVVDVEERQNHYHLTIRDDGAGLDDERIAAIARDKEGIDQELVETYIRDQEIWRILFLPGFSSKSEVSQISGRGVGLDAVQHTVTNYGGTIYVETALNVGTTFTIELPIK